MGLDTDSFKAEVLSLEYILPTSSTPKEEALLRDSRCLPAQRYATPRADINVLGAAAARVKVSVISNPAEIC